MVKIEKAKRPEKGKSLCFCSPFLFLLFFFVCFWLVARCFLARFIDSARPCGEVLALSGPLAWSERYLRVGSPEAI